MIKTKELNCGVRIILEDIPYVRSVTFGIFVRTGSVDEDLRYNGISHYIEHMMFKGTDRRSARQIAEDVDRIAGNINAYTSKEHTCYHIKTLESNAMQAIEILTDMFMHSRFDTVEMNRERNVIFEEMSMVEDTPDDLAYEMASANVFKGNPLEKSIIGTKTSLKRINRKVMTDYIAEQYTADSIVIAVCGKFDEDKICEEFDKRLQGIRRTKSVLAYTEVPHTPAYSVRVKEIEQSHIMLATRSINLDDDLYYALALLSNALGGTMSSRLFQNVREQKGLAYSVYSMNSSYRDMGAFMIYAGVSHGNIHKAMDAIKEELDLLKRDGITEDELNMSKEQLKGTYIYGLENVNHRMVSLGKNLLLQNKVYTPEEVIKGIDDVTMEDIARCTEMISDINTYSAAVVSDHRVRLKDIVLG